jgi:hypothetical protein
MRSYDGRGRSPVVLGVMNRDGRSPVVVKHACIAADVQAARSSGGTTSQWNSRMDSVVIFRFEGIIAHERAKLLLPCYSGGHVSEGRGDRARFRRT